MRSATLTILFFLFWVGNLLLTISLSTHAALWLEILLLSTAWFLYRFRAWLALTLITAEVTGVFLLSSSLPLSFFQAIHSWETLCKTVLFLLFLLLTWLVMLQLKNTRPAVTTALPQGYNNAVQILPLEEFLDKAKGLDAPQPEAGYLVTVTTTRQSFFTPTAVESCILQAAHAALSPGDLICQKSLDCFLLLLPYASKTKAEQAAATFTGSLQKTLYLPVTACRFTVYPLPNSWSETKALFTGSALPSRKCRKQAAPWRSLLKTTLRKTYRVSIVPILTIYRQKINPLLRKLAPH